MIGRRTLPAGRCGLVLASLLGLAAAFPSTVLAEQRWDALAATVFAHVAQDAELPNAAFPQALAQDGDGFLWVGTENGLARWDGYHFRVYKPDPEDPGSLPDSVIDALHTDARGTLWIGTDAHGVVRYDRVHDRFARAGSGAGGRTASAVLSIADDGRGGIVAGTDRGLEEIGADATGDDRAGADAALGDRGTSRPRPVGRELPGRDVHAVLRDRWGALWVGTDRGLLRRANGGRQFVPVAFAALPPDSVDVRRLFEDEDGRLWIGTQANGAFTIEAHATAAVPIGEMRPGATPLALESATAFVQPRHGTVWIGTGDGGIVAVDVRTRRYRRIVHDPNLPTSLPSDTVMDFLRDRAGLTWVATTRGISFCDARQTAIATLFGPSPEPGGLSNGNIRSILPAPGGRLWVGLGSNGADLIDPSDTAGVHVRLPAQPGAAKLSGARALAALPDGDTIFGGFGGMARLRASARTPVDGTLVPPFGAGFSIRSMRFAAGRLWFSGLNGGVWSLTAAGDAALVRDPRTGAPLTGDRVTLIEPGPGSSVWLGTSRGLVRFDPRAGIVERIGVDPLDPAALTSGLVATALTDRRGRLWVGTQGGGIDVLVARDRHGRPVFRRLGTAAGLPNDSVDKLVADRHGTIWASTDAGIAAIDPATFAIRTFGVADGLGISGYWINSGTAGTHGEVYFGGLGGLTVVRPDALRPRVFDAPIVATEIRLGGKPIAWAAAANQPLSVTPQANSVSVEFAALDLSAPEHYRYAYRLVGYDADWTEVDATHRFAAYTNLPPGMYHLRVRAADRGTWDARSLDIALGVAPAWHQTLAFRCLFAAAVLGALAVVMRARTAYLQRRQRELEREVAARTAELHATQIQLEKIAYFDTLTALPNRRMFTEEFAKLIAAAARGEQSFALVLLDLDGFKTVNDTLGHDAGDAVLVAAAQRLRSAVRSSDVVARLGGDEFALLLAGRPTPDEVEAICRRVVAEFAAPVPLASAATVTHTSLGAALCPRDGTTQEALYKSADLALYSAKRSGRNTWRWYDRALRA